MDVLESLGPKLPYKKLQDVLHELCNGKSEGHENWTSLADTGLALAQSLTHSLFADVDNRSELEKLVVHLWNKTVALKTKGVLEKLVYGKLRHISYLLASFLYESSGDLAQMKMQIMMGIKTTRAWIDAKEWNYAESVLISLQEIAQKLQRSLVEKKNATQGSEEQVKEMNNVEKDYFCMLCLKAEVKFAQVQNEEAMTSVKKAGEMVAKFPSEAFNLSMLCYNFGVDCYQSKDYGQGVSWLRESCNINKDIVDPNPKTQARTLRLLANCYLEEKGADWKENALNAVTLANQKYCHEAGLYVKLQLLLETEDQDMNIQHGLQELMDHHSFDLDLCINTLKLFNSFHRPGIPFNIRQTIINKFERHPEINSLLVNLMDIFIQSEDLDHASVFAEECIKGHNTGQRLEGTSLKQFHIFFWMKAAQYFEKQDYENAVMWYNYSLSLYGSMSSSEPNMARLQRNLANCYLHLNQIEKAAAAIEIAGRCDRKDPHTQYIIFKIALEQNDPEKATESLRELVDCINTRTDQTNLNIICLVAHTALERKRSELASIALECLINNSDEDKIVLTALKCLLRLLVDEMETNDRIDKKNLLCHIRTAYNKILGARDRGRMASAEVEEESQWFMKIAWNLALQCKGDPFCMKEFFNLCCQLLTLCPVNSENFQRHQKCLLMSVAACLQLAREPVNSTQMQDLLEEALQHVEEFKNTENTTRKAIGSKDDVCLRGDTQPH